MLAFQPGLDIRAAFSLLECSLSLPRGCQSLKLLPPFHAHRQHPRRRVHHPVRVLIIPANQVIRRTNVITPIASGLQHVNVPTHQTDDLLRTRLRVRSCSTPTSVGAGQLSYIGKMCAVSMPCLRPRASKSRSKVCGLRVRPLVDRFPTVQHRTTDCRAARFRTHPCKTVRQMGWRLFGEVPEQGNSCHVPEGKTLMGWLRKRNAVSCEGHRRAKLGW